MEINGWDISKSGARQHRVTYGNHSIGNDSEWERGSPAPVLLKNKIGFQTLKIILVVKGQSREEIQRNCSEILARLIAPAQLKLDHHTNMFCGILKKHSTKEITQDRWHNLELEFDGYEYGEKVTVTASGETEITVENTGNIITPAIVKITPQIGTAFVVLTGICTESESGKSLPVTVKELQTGKTVILNGETGIFEQDGQIKTELEIWALPALMPGTNIITVDSNRMDITVEFFPRYM